MLIRLVEFFSSDLGTNYYSFGIQLTLFISLLAYVYFSIQNKKLPYAQAFIALGVIYALQLALGATQALSQILAPFADVPAPLIDRSAILLQVLWVFPILNPAGSKRQLWLLGLLSGIVGLVSWAWPYLAASAWQAGNFNDSALAFYGSLSISVLAALLFLARSSSQNPFGTFRRIFYGFVFLAGMLDMVFIPFPGDYAGFIRIGMLITLPMLLAVPAFLQPAPAEINQEILKAFIKRIEQTTDDFIKETLSAPVAPGPTRMASEIGLQPAVIEDTQPTATVADWNEEHAALLNEVRQPLFSIIGYADLLGRETHGNLGEVQKKYLERIKSAASSIEYKVDEINRLREVEQGALRFIPELVELPAILTAAIVNFEATIEDKSLQVKQQVTSANPKLVTDRSSVLSIFNLALENAVVASRPTSEITVVIADAPDKPGFLQCTFTDSGEGLTADELPLVFQKRVAISDPLVSGLGDKGVGLSVLKAMVEGLHGEVSVRSTPKVGTSITVELPRNIAGSFQPIAPEA